MIDFIPTFTAGPRFFSKELCEEILHKYNGQESRPAELINSVNDKNIRQGRVTWVNPEKEECVGRIIEAYEAVNEANYKFDLVGFTEPLQFSRYEKPGDCYNWHKDIANKGQVRRKLSFSIQLSDEKSYEGGDLEFFLHPGKTFREQGTIIFFPSYEIHRVSPIISGQRYSLVGWISGPVFR